MMNACVRDYTTPRGDADAIDRAMMRAESLGPATARLIVGAEACETVRDDQFSVLRRADSIEDDFLRNNFDFASLSAGGGKGGDSMARTRDGRFFVKFLNESDGKSLLEDSFLREYVARVTSGQSLVTKIFAVFVHEKHGRFIVMNNCVNPRVKMWSRLYDLKGTADDKTLVADGSTVYHSHKRWYNVPLMVRECFGCFRAVPVRRRRYLKGKHEAFDAPIYLTEEQREEVMTALRNDVALFEKHNLMDYSLLVAVERVPTHRIKEEATMLEGDVHNKPYVVEYGGEVLIIYFGIIDFLQSWTGGKKVAHVIKYLFAPRPISTVHPTPYAKQFIDFFDFKFKPMGFEFRKNSSAKRADSTPSKSAASPSFVERLKSAAGVAVLPATAMED